MSRILIVLLFSATAGLTVSGITANLYRLLAKKPQSPAASALHLAVMVFAGASVLIENSTTSMRSRDCSRLAYGFALLLATYWCFILGLFTLAIGEAI